MKPIAVWLARLIAIFLIGDRAVAVDRAAQDLPSCTLQLTIEGAINPGTLDHIERGMKRAETLSCSSILLLINTPGGSLATTRRIVERILSSPRPFLCLVSPAGGHAGSAGAILLSSCHVNGAEPATNIGAATPISAAGDLAHDVREKTIQDTLSWVVSLAKLRGRNLEFAEQIVTQAKAVDADEAVRIGAIDTLAFDRARFLDFAEGREVAMSAGLKTQVRTGAIVAYAPDFRSRFLQFVTDPQFAYLIFMASLALLYFEITHAGAILPGVVGGIGLIISLISFHLLEVRWGGAGLIALGLGFLLAEAFLPSFGALGIGGLIALATGSVLLYDPGPGESSLPYSLIAATTLTAAVAMFLLGFLVLRTRQKGAALADQRWLDQIGEVASLESPSLRRGMLKISGEYWQFKSEKDLRVGDTVEVIRQEALTLHVKPRD